MAKTLSKTGIVNNEPILAAHVTQSIDAWDGTGGGDTREITFNEAHEDLDVRIEGDTDTDLFFTNAGTDKVGIGTKTPSSKLQVDGDITTTHITASGNLKVNGSQIDFSNLPTSDPSVAGRLWNSSGDLRISAG